MEREIGEHRMALLAGLSGRVVEVGAGNGMNFPHYPPTVVEVVAVEPEAYLRTLAQRAAADAPVPVSVRAGTAEQLPVQPGEFDAAIASLVLCSVGDPPQALAELHRALKPGGQLRFLEHVRDEQHRKARIQTAFDRAGVWPLIAGGCHCSRDTVATIREAGFEVQELQEIVVPPSWGLTNPIVLGAARALPVA